MCGRLFEDERSMWELLCARANVSEGRFHAWQSSLLFAAMFVS